MALGMRAHMRAHSPPPVLFFHSVDTYFPAVVLDDLAFDGCAQCDDSEDDPEPEPSVVLTGGTQYPPGIREQLCKAKVLADGSQFHGFLPDQVREGDFCDARCS